MTCDDCVFAVWKRKSNGSLHPDKSGRCGYVKRIALPASEGRQWYGANVDDRDVIIKGGYIERGVQLRYKCAYYGRATP